ncbi:MAG: CHASE domain-containing protein, partial [Gammaproteobacteria bacterium]|nr:CHASE domain-containing protein [Gammaproteobacteria bacterium]
MQYGEVSFRQVLGSRHGLVAWLLLGLALLITLVLWQFSVLLVEDRTRARFENQSRQLKTAIEERLLNYEQVLAGAAGLFAVADLVGREGWRTYVKRLDIERYYPGIQGIGYTERVADQDVSRHIERVREQGLPDYLISPAGTRTEYHPVVYLEPSTRRNRRAYGYDAFGDPAHRDAMERARDSGMATMTGRVVLVQEVGDDEQPGFLMYFPVYAGDRVPEYLADRRLALRGYVFSAFRMNNLM